MAPAPLRPELEARHGAIRRRKVDQDLREIPSPEESAKEGLSAGQTAGSPVEPTGKTAAWRNGGARLAARSGREVRPAAREERLAEPRKVPQAGAKTGWGVQPFQESWGAAACPEA